jgi:hypothetical protein
VSELPGRRRRAACGAALFSVLLVVTACGSDTDGRVTVASSSTAAAAGSAAARFCTGWPEAVKAEDESALDAFLRDPPPELAEAAAIIRKAEAARAANAEPDFAVSDAAYGDVMAWVEVNCNADSKQRHVAPPAGADLAGLLFCSAGGEVPLPQLDPAGEDERDGAVLLGEADRADPYDGPMIGLFSAKQGDGGFAGDGDPTPVTVRGTDGAAAPITVFQQTIVPEVGTVIAWTEAGRDYGLFGRLWPQERTGELVTLANRLEMVDGRLVLPAAARPDGYEQVYAGPTSADWSIITNGFVGDYYVRYQRPGGEPLSLAGAQLTPADFDGFRFFGLPIPHVQIGGHDALFGSLWSENDGPWVATWREPDGFAVRIVSIGPSREQVRAIAEQSRDLDRAEWAKLVQTDGNCPQP